MDETEIGSIVVTGASSGIGAALAAAFARPGARLLLVGRDRTRLDIVAERCRARGALPDIAALDVRDEPALRAALQSFDSHHPADVVIASAGITNILEADAVIEPPQTFRLVIETNLVGAYNTVAALAERMAARGRGRIALIGSLAGYRGFAQAPAYCASKAALKAFGEAMRTQLRPRGVAVTIALPGFVATPLEASYSSPKPLRMTADAAAWIIARAIRRRRACVAFPRSLAFGATLLALLPPRLGDRLVRTVRVTGHHRP